MMDADIGMSWETWVRSLGWEDPLEEGMATHSSILAWRMPWTEKPGGLQSMGSKEYTPLSDFHFHFRERRLLCRDEQAKISKHAVLSLPGFMFFTVLL